VAHMYILSHWGQFIFYHIEYIIKILMSGNL